MSEQNNVCESCAPAIKIEALKNEVTELKQEDKRINERIDKLDEKFSDKISDTSAEIRDIERKLSDQLLTLKVTYQLSAEAINLNINNLGKKIDDIINDNKNNHEKVDDRRYDWLKSVGLVVVGIILAYIAKKLGLA